MKKVVAVLFFIASASLSADLVPYSIKSIENTSEKGFLKLIGPGKYEISGKSVDYTNNEAVYISISNIDSLTEVGSVKDACILNYSSNGYSEKISIINQSCLTVMKIINAAK